MNKKPKEEISIVTMKAKQQKLRTNQEEAEKNIVKIMAMVMAMVLAMVMALVMAMVSSGQSQKCHPNRRLYGFWNEFRVFAKTRLTPEQSPEVPMRVWLQRAHWTSGQGAGDAARAGEIAHGGEIARDGEIARGGETARGGEIVRSLCNERSHRGTASAQGRLFQSGESDRTEARWSPTVAPGSQLGVCLSRGYRPLSGPCRNIKKKMVFYIR